MQLLRRFRDEIVVVLLVALAALSVACLVKAGVVTWDWFARHKEGIDALSSVLGILAVGVGAFAAYYRFFKGRTFTTRADVQLSVTVHPHGDHKTLHAICLTLKNVGTFPIWNPRPLITVRVHGPEAVSSEYDITEWWTPHDGPNSEGTASVVDTSETTSFYATHSMDRKAWSVTYVSSVRDEAKNVWRTGLTITNDTGEHKQ